MATKKKGRKDLAKVKEWFEENREAAPSAEQEEALEF